MDTTIDQARVEAFAQELFGAYTGGMVSLMVDIGHDTGLFEAAAEGPATSDELADRAGLEERYVREWLGSLTTAGVFTHDPEAGTFTLPPEHAALLTGDTSANIAPLSGMISVFGSRAGRIADCFRDGGGIPYSEYRPDFTELMDGLSRTRYDDLLLTDYLPTAPGLVSRLEDGIRVADIGCGTGHAVNVMARAYPASTFVGYDIATDAIEKATEEAQAWGLENARFEVLDVTELPADPPFDLITAFDVIHDQASPDVVLRRVHEALADDGTFLVLDIDAASSVAENLEHPLAPFLYGVSVLHCMTVSLAEDGAGLGTVWGRQLAIRMLREAGFGEVEVHDGPEEDPVNCLYVCRP